MFNFIKKATCGPQIAIGGGINTVGNGIIRIGEVVAGTGAILQANGWLRRIVLAGVKVTVVDEKGKELDISQHDALMYHFCSNLPLKFTAIDEDNKTTVEAATRFQAEFDKRSGRPIEAPKASAKAPTQKSVKDELEQLSDEDLEGAC